MLEVILSWTNIPSWGSKCSRSLHAAEIRANCCHWWATWFVSFHWSTPVVGSHRLIYLCHYRRRKQLVCTVLVFHSSSHMLLWFASVYRRISQAAILWLIIQLGPQSKPLAILCSLLHFFPDLQVLLNSWGNKKILGGSYKNLPLVSWVASHQHERVRINPNLWERRCAFDVKVMIMMLAYNHTVGLRSHWSFFLSDLIICSLIRQSVNQSFI